MKILILTSRSYITL